MKKRIPTIVGLLVLLGALISGLLFFGDGTGVFAPRATAETTPKNIRITNLTDSGFTVTFFTEKATSGFVKYGTDPAKLNSQVGDDRDQLSGTVGEYSLHHITIRGLESSSEYYFILGTDSKTEYDNEGEPFSIKIPAKISSQMPPAITVYGSISREGGTPAEGSIVYLSSEKMGDLSALVKGSGSWAVPLSQSLNKEGTDYAGLEESDALELLVQGEKITDKIKYQAIVADAQPVEELTFGQVYEQLAQDDTETEETEQEVSEASQEAQLADLEEEDLEEATISGRLLELLDDADPLPTESTASSELILGESSGEPVVTNSSPEIIGAAVPGVQVQISVHSETNYETTLTTDDDGSFKLSLEELGLELEPGEHTVTYSYIDPSSGKEVTVTETFLVEDPDRVLLAQASNPSPTAVVTSSPTPSPTSQPYGSGNPYPMNVPSPMPTTPVLTPTIASESTSATRKQPVGTDSSLTEAGSIGATLLVALAGGFFILMGSWSWWLASELEEE